MEISFKAFCHTKHKQKIVWEEKTYICPNHSLLIPSILIKTPKKVSIQIQVSAALSSVYFVSDQFWKL